MYVLVPAALEYTYMYLNFCLMSVLSIVAADFLLHHRSLDQHSVCPEPSSALCCRITAHAAVACVLPPHVLVLPVQRSCQHKACCCSSSMTPLPSKPSKSAASADLGCCHSSLLHHLATGNSAQQYNRTRSEGTQLQPGADAGSQYGKQPPHPPTHPLQQDPLQQDMSSLPKWELHRPCKHRQFEGVHYVSACVCVQGAGVPCGERGRELA